VYEEAHSPTIRENLTTFGGGGDVLYSEAPAILIRTRLRHAERSSGQGPRAELTPMGKLGVFQTRLTYAYHLTISHLYRLYLNIIRANLDTNNQERSVTAFSVSRLQ